MSLSDTGKRVMGRPKRVLTPEDQAGFDEVQALNRAFSTIAQAESRLCRLMIDLGVPGAHVLIVGDSAGMPVATLGSSKKVFMHPCGRRMFESKTVYFDQAIAAINEIGEWLKTQRAA